MQAGPAKANELFAKLFDTSDGAVKTRDKLFAELKIELELHASLEEQHLFPILRRNAETKGLIAEAIKDNKDLRARLAELEGMPKNDEAFSDRLKELQKTFRQHARDEKRELLPAVQRALSEEQVQGVAEKMEAGVAEAEQARQDEAEQRRLKARQERERAERHTERQAEAEQEEAEQRRAKGRHEREATARQTEQQAAFQETHEDGENRLHDAAVAVTRTATEGPANVLRVVKDAATSAMQAGEEMRGVADAYAGAARRMVPDPRAVAALPRLAGGVMADIPSAWIELMGQAARASASLSQDVMLQAAEWQRQFAVDAMQRWIEHNTRLMKTGIRMAQAGLRFEVDPIRWTGIRVS